tara:strand:+ start:148 stop:429 length:282 start_codon:yes stop_codon:yes gene_type:complete
MKAIENINILNIDTNEKLTLPVGEEREIVTLYTFARWTALIRGLEAINKKAHQLKINLNTDKSWVKPLALQKYIDQETPSTVAEVKTLVDNEE